jgi:hypothetical protein
MVVKERYRKVAGHDCVFGQSKTAVAQIEEMIRLLENDEEFRKLWEADRPELASGGPSTRSRAGDGGWGPTQKAHVATGA